MAIDFKALASFGFKTTGVSVPTSPTITAVDNEDGTGAVVTIAGYDSGTTNVLYVADADGIFVCKGSTWVSDEMDLALINGHYHAFVQSANASGSIAVSDMLRFTCTGGCSAATDNINTAKKVMKATAVYWAPESTYDAYGKPVANDPCELSCRWDDEEEEFLDSNGTLQKSKAKVIVDRDVMVGGILMLGELADIADAANPKNNDGAWEIRMFLKNPDFKGSKYIRQAYL